MELTQEQQKEINAIDEKIIAELKSQGADADEPNLFKIYQNNKLRYIFFRGDIQEENLKHEVKKYLFNAFYDDTVPLSQYVHTGWAVKNGPIHWVNQIAVVKGNPYIVTIR